MGIIELTSPTGRKSGGRIDTTTGAPAHVRVLVGGAPTAEGRLATLRRFFPDAERDVVDPDNFVFTNPETGRLTLYNPKGFDLGDVAGVTREVSQVAGGTAGAIAGTPGGIPGAIAGGALGTAAGEELFNVVARAFGTEDPRTLGERSLETALIGATGALAGFGTSAVGAGVRGTTKAAFRGGAAGQREAAAAVEDLGRFGAVPSVSQATKSPALDTIETFIARTPGGAGRIRKAVDRTREQITEGIERLARRVAGGRVPEPFVAGRTVRLGIEGPGGFVPRFQAKAEVLFNRLDEFIPATKPVTPTQTKTVLSELALPVPAQPELSAVLSQPAIRKFAQAFEGVEDIPYAVLKQFRSAVGRKLSSGDLISDIPRADLKQLYGAITRDMEAAAKATGPLAEKAFMRANAFYKAGIARIDDVLEPLIKNKVPEQIFDAIERAGRQGPTKIRAIRRSLTEEQWRAVIGPIIKRIGKAKPSAQLAEEGEFAFDTFLTNWNAIGKEAKDALFSGAGLKGLRENLDALGRAASRVRESSQMFRNPPGTATSLIGQAMILGGGVAPIAGAATFATGELLVFPAMLGMVMVQFNLAARLMTSPGFVKWLAQTTKIKPTGFASHLGRLAGIAAISEPETKAAILEYLGIFRDASREKSESVATPPAQRGGELVNPALVGP